MFPMERWEVRLRLLANRGISDTGDHSTEARTAAAVRNPEKPSDTDESARDIAPVVRPGPGNSHFRAAAAEPPHVSSPQDDDAATEAEDLKEAPDEESNEESADGRGDQGAEESREQVVAAPAGSSRRARRNTWPKFKQLFRTGLKGESYGEPVKLSAKCVKSEAEEIYGWVQAGTMTHKAAVELISVPAHIEEDLLRYADAFPGQCKNITHALAFRKRVLEVFEGLSAGDQEIAIRLATLESPLTPVAVGAIPSVDSSVEGAAGLEQHSGETVAEETGLRSWRLKERGMLPITKGGGDRGSALEA